MAARLTIEWSPDALTDLDRFARFLHARHPDLARRIGSEIVASVERLTTLPHIGKRVGNSHYRQTVLHVLNGAYVMQYRVEGSRLVILRVFHGREAR